LSAHCNAHALGGAGGAHQELLETCTRVALSGLAQAFAHFPDGECDAHARDELAEGARFEGFDADGLAVICPKLVDGALNLRRCTFGRAQHLAYGAEGAVGASLGEQFGNEGIGQRGPKDLVFDLLLRLAQLGQLFVAGQRTGRELERHLCRGALGEQHNSVIQIGPRHGRHACGAATTDGCVDRAQLRGRGQDGLHLASERVGRREVPGADRLVLGQSVEAAGVGSVLGLG
jgi:hypothetical protein